MHAMSGFFKRQLFLDNGVCSGMAWLQENTGKELFNPPFKLII